jgi:hypothetical protein
MIPIVFTIYCSDGKRIAKNHGQVGPELSGLFTVAMGTGWTVEHDQSVFPNEIPMSHNDFADGIHGEMMQFQFFDSVQTFFVEITVVVIRHLLFSSTCFE